MQPLNSITIPFSIKYHYISIIILCSSRCQSTLYSYS